MSGIVGAIGAAQLATIVATPISAYEDGTNDHPGGNAIVGDGGKPEVVYYDKKAWITPDVPTIIDLPKHAKVFPDVSSYEQVRGMLSSDYLMTRKNSEEKINILNVYSSLQKTIEKGNNNSEKQTELLRKILSESRSSKLDLYMMSRM